MYKSYKSIYRKIFQEKFPNITHFLERPKVKGSQINGL